MAVKKACDGRVVGRDALPLDYILAVMRDPAVEDARRERMARLALPYCHEKVMYNRPNKTQAKARAAGHAGKGTAWENLINAGTPLAPIGANASSLEKV